MEGMEGKTKVIFRKWKDTGDIIAVFPEILATPNYHLCQSYMHIGQHGACDPFIISDGTTPTFAEEYKDLQEELTQMGYDLQIIKRNRYVFIQTRYDEAVRLGEIARGISSQK